MYYKEKINIVFSDRDLLSEELINQLMKIKPIKGRITTTTFKKLIHDDEIQKALLEAASKLPKLLSFEEEEEQDEEPINIVAKSIVYLYRKNRYVHFLKADLIHCINTFLNIAHQKY